MYDNRSVAVDSSCSYHEIQHCETEHRAYSIHRPTAHLYLRDASKLRVHHLLECFGLAQSLSCFSNKLEALPRRQIYSVLSDEYTSSCMAALVPPRRHHRLPPTHSPQTQTNMQETYTHSITYAPHCARTAISDNAELRCSTVRCGE